MGPESLDYLGLVQQATEQPEAFQDLAPPLRVALMMAGFAFLTAGLVCVSAFTRIVIVLSFVRRALSTQEIPPNPVVIGLAMFLTIFVMGSTLDGIATEAVQPLMTKDSGMTGQQALRIGMDKLHAFMLRNTRKDDLKVMIHIANANDPQSEGDTPMRVLIPAFMISEIKTAFIMGFCIFVPFLMVDLVVSTVLMSLGMMMMPPVMVSLPLKLLLFVLVDGWQLVAYGLSASYG